MKINLTNYSNNEIILEELNHTTKRYEALREEYYNEEIDREIKNLHKTIFNKLVEREFISAVYNINKMKQIVSAFDKVVYNY